MNSDIEKKAKYLISKSRSSIPIDLNKIVTFLKIKVILKDFEDSISGVLLKKDKQIGDVIAINRNHPLTRKRFSIAHEIGHFVLSTGNKNHLDMVFRKENLENKLDKDEISANQFAAALLMPRSELVKEITSKRIKTMADVEKLSNKFNVSREAMTFRLMNLGIL
jgi:Zn-dependent peptidase ImmA (M78 family)